jgi:hypothetical protein
LVNDNLKKSVPRKMRRNRSRAPLKSTIIL